jgi:alpha-L-fucosidase
MEYEVEDMSGVRLCASDAGVQTFVEAGYGLSVHWGLYSLLRATEWGYYQEKVPFDEYRALMARFDPVRFEAAEWADLMLETGQKFVIVTSKHHDGFCLWDTALTDFKVTNAAFGRDVIAELAPALHERGLALHFYYSLLDWTHPAYRSDWTDYVAYYQGQIRELCTHFGPIGGFVFDGDWPRQVFEGEEIDWFEPRGNWDLAGTYDLIHELQPDAVIANNSHIQPLPGEDYQVCELDLPGQNTTGFNTTEVSGLPLASWWNVNAGWSYQPWRHAVKSAEALLATYRAVRAADAVCILNVGPRSFGDIHPQEAQVLRELGQMIRQE